MQLNVEIPKKTEYFLKRLAAQQFDGSILNFLSFSPIHIVQHAEPNYTEVEFIDDADFLSVDGEERPLSVDNFVRNSLCIPYDAQGELVDEINTARILEGESLYIPFEEQEECVTEYLKLFGIDTSEIHGYIETVGDWVPAAYSFTRASAMQLMSEMQGRNEGVYRAFADSSSENGDCNDFPVLYNLLIQQGQQLLDEDWKAFKYELIRDPDTDIRSIEKRVDAEEPLPIHVGTLVVTIPEEKAMDELLPGRYELDISFVKEEENDYSYPFAADVTLSFPETADNEMDLDKHGLASIQYPFTGENKYDCLASEEGWKRIFDFARFMA